MIVTDAAALRIKSIFYFFPPINFFQNWKKDKYNIYM